MMSRNGGAGGGSKNDPHAALDSETEWLVSDTIDSYVDEVRVHLKTNGVENVYICKTHFNFFLFPVTANDRAKRIEATINQRELEVTERTKQKIEVLLTLPERCMCSYDYVMFPINLNDGHWILAFVSFADKYVLVLDSMGDSVEHARTLWAWLYAETMQFASTDIPKMKVGWKILVPLKEDGGAREIAAYARQQDRSNCGVYTCLAMKCIARHLTKKKSLTVDTLKREDLFNRLKSVWSGIKNARGEIREDITNGIRA